MAATRKGTEPEVVRITTAGTSHADDLRQRQRRYLFAMSIRTVCFIGTIVTASLGWGYVWPFLLVGAIFLPYIAVVLANVQAPRTDDFSLRTLPTDTRELGAGSGAGEGRR